jgi:phosphatidylserine/phosphatidylglycerophosphate/cardiolipin synthase-like enzyme
MAVPFSSGKTLIDYLILRLGNYPQDGGTRPVFVGSFNLDPCSAYLNIELAIMVDGPALATAVVHFMEEGMSLDNAYHVQTDQRGESGVGCRGIRRGRTLPRRTSHDVLGLAGDRGAVPPAHRRTTLRQLP